jgi:aminoglycoside phosphotransferase (APT) family kinase protein
MIVPLDSTEPTPVNLLAHTLARFVAADAQITHIDGAPLGGGMSGAAVRRYTVSYSTGAGAATTRLITKDADLHEWHVLRHLNAQQQPNIPFAYALDDARDGRILICMQDVGDSSRPTSLDPITEIELSREAAGLAAIHSANFQQRPHLGWLPQMTRSYVQEMLFQRAWRPAWEAALANPAFSAAFRDIIPRVEAAAATIVDDMDLLLQEPATQTLIHADLNPSNVLVDRGIPYIIDWQTAMWGPFYIDLPHHHCTLRQAEHYRQALAARGYPIAPGDFAKRYRVAARYIGFRYMWWTLEYWMTDQTQTQWVRHYTDLVTGAGIL